MRSFTIILTLFFLSLSKTFFSQDVNEDNWQNGDIVFIKNAKLSNTQSANDKDKFNCMGIILIENGHPFVYYAAGEPLKKISFHDFIALSEGKKYSIKWLNEKGVITEDVVKTMRTYAAAKLGTAYDDKENLNSDEFYNAEFVWKIYRSCVGTHLCEPKEIGAEPNKKITDKSLANKYVSVRDIYKSELLE